MNKEEMRRFNKLYLRRVNSSESFFVWAQGGGKRKVKEGGYLAGEQYLRAQKKFQGGKQKPRSLNQWQKVTVASVSS